MTEPPKHKARRLALRTVGGHFILGCFMCKLKKALTYDEQVDWLEQFHSLTVNDRSRAIEILKSVNYYRLSGYGIGLKEPTDKEKYKKGISLDFLYSLYLFDSNLRNILIHTIEYIEFSSEVVSLISSLINTVLKAIWIWLILRIKDLRTVHLSTQISLII